MKNFKSVSSTQNSENSMKRAKIFVHTMQYLQNMFIEYVDKNKIKYTNFETYIQLFYNKSNTISKNRF